MPGRRLVGSRRVLLQSSDDRSVEVRTPSSGSEVPRRGSQAHGAGTAAAAGPAVPALGPQDVGDLQREGTGRRDEVAPVAAQRGAPGDRSGSVTAPVALDVEPAAMTEAAVDLRDDAVVVLTVAAPGLAER